MSPRWTTRLEATIGPSGQVVTLRSRLPWRRGRPLWQAEYPAPTSRDGAPAALHEALAAARASVDELGAPWPTSLLLEIDDAWVQHACLRGAFDAMGHRAIAESVRGFFAQALGAPAGTLALCSLPQPDGRSLWVSCLPVALCTGLAESAMAHGLALTSLRPAAQGYLGDRRRWPRDGVLALPHGAGVLLACRRNGSWVAMSNELRPFDAAVGERAAALSHFHGTVLADGMRWAATPPGQAPLPGWTPVATSRAGRP
ncbi:hypothetical protein [Ideonella sp. A 288]|uniref:hypothetical protein n=1 Tax=Ideonella sp. A 288 TaxID=1962181 RepID=UPI000B4BEA67|nr:hypothetical protein [Ideonella sp. A 288]